jgi:hypothetical protein
MPALPYWVPALIIGSSCVFALVEGGREERIAALYFGLAALAAPFILDRSWGGTQWAMFTVDLGYLVLVAFFAMRTDHWWPLFATAFQLLAVLTHLASLIDRHLQPWAYVTAGVIWTYLGLAAIVVGAYNRWRERRQLAAIGAAAIEEPGATRR